MPLRRISLKRAGIANRRSALTPHHSPFTTHSLRRGLSLFEVIIALTIFVASAGAIGQLVSTGVRGALRARLETEAMLRCESAMGEFVAGVTPLQSTQNVAFSDSSDWVWSASVSSAPQVYLYQVEVTVSHSAGGPMGKVSYSLKRLVRDPTAAELAAEEQALLQEQQQAQTSTTSSQSGSQGGTP